VIGGWVGLQLGHAWVSELRTFAARHALVRPMSAATIQLCQLHNPIGIGAATFALEGFLLRTHTWVGVQ
jgi:hypothetical protein